MEGVHPFQQSGPHAIVKRISYLTSLQVVFYRARKPPPRRKTRSPSRSKRTFPFRAFTGGPSLLVMMPARKCRRPNPAVGVFTEIAAESHWVTTVLAIGR